MRYRTLFAAVVVVALASVSCSKDDAVENLSGDPIPQGMAAISVAATTGGVTAFSNFMNQAAVVSVQSLRAAPRPIAVGAFPAQSPVQCAGGGTITITNQSDTGFTATFTNCADGIYTSHGTAVATMVLRTPQCNEDGQNTDVPESLNSTVNGSVDIDGQTVTLTNFGIAMTNPTYSEGTGGTCALLSADLHATGKLSETSGGITTTINLGTSSLDVHFVDSDGETELTFNAGSSLTFATACTSGTVLNLETVSDQALLIADGSVTPHSGVLAVTPQGGSTVTVDYSTAVSDVPCTGLL